MADRANPFRNIRLISRPAPRKLKILLAVLITAGILALAALGIVHGRIRQQTREALDQAAALEQENADLAEKATDPMSGDSIRDIAKDQLGLVEPGTIIIDTE